MIYKIDLRIVLGDIVKLSKTHHKLKRGLEKACEKLEKDPKFGDLFGYLPSYLPPDCIRHCDVLGRKGFRLIYYWKTDGDTIYGLMLFQRKEEYNSVDWARVSRRIREVGI